jgi:hypothetical protein
MAADLILVSETFTPVTGVRISRASDLATDAQKHTPCVLDRLRSRMQEQDRSSYLVSLVNSRDLGWKSFCTAFRQRSRLAVVFTIND